MTTNLLTYSQTLISSLTIGVGRLQAYVDGLLTQAEVDPQTQPQKDKLPVWAIILIAVGVVICLIFLCPVVIIAILTLLGPSIGNIFSNIILDI